MTKYVVSSKTGESYSFKGKYFWGFVKIPEILKILSSQTYFTLQYCTLYKIIV